MILDPEGIARVCQWHNAESGGMPDWGLVAEALVPFGIEAHEARSALVALAPVLQRLPDTMLVAGVDDALIERLTSRIVNVTSALVSARPHARKQ